ncbi:hypothetical protein CYMTET_50503 [Cymbomonas tetramitiformis]|uniref:Uncharacterized protein n=1 Tax=Cymbomonas tetramitiformis TaxID=36881 RepID=A0AAE0BMX4_9CHLO|nr:hypothetical protein CYMTET_50503 [Cymbomonas tetramitiformis]
MGQCYSGPESGLNFPVFEAQCLKRQLSFDDLTVDQVRDYAQKLTTSNYVSKDELNETVSMFMNVLQAKNEAIEDLQTRLNKATQEKQVIDELRLTVSSLQAELSLKETEKALVEERRKQLEIVNVSLSSDVVRMECKLEELQKGALDSFALGKESSSSLMRKWAVVGSGSSSAKSSDKLGSHSYEHQNKMQYTDDLASQGVRLAAALRVLQSVSSLLEESPTSSASPSPRESMMAA